MNLNIFNRWRGGLPREGGALLRGTTSSPLPPIKRPSVEVPKIRGAQPVAHNTGCALFQSRTCGTLNPQPSTLNWQMVEAEEAQFEDALGALLDMWLEEDFERAESLCEALTKMIRRKRLEVAASEMGLVKS
jgi:hypothetical protein